MAELILGPLLRHVGTDDVTVWVETDAACEVEVRTRVRQRDRAHICGRRAPLRDRRARRAAGRRVRGVHGPARRHAGMAAGRQRVSAERPAHDRPVAPAPGPVRIVPGGVRGRRARPDRLRRGRPRGRMPGGWSRVRPRRGPWACSCSATRSTPTSPRSRPANGSPPVATRPSRRTTQVANFEEYTHLYQEAWSDPDVRWLLSVVPSSMIFDDHDVLDDWNTSRAWRDEMQATSWWEERITGALSSYWIYQHLGNLSPAGLAADETLPRGPRRVRRRGGPARLRPGRRQGGRRRPWRAVVVPAGPRRRAGHHHRLPRGPDPRRRDDG